MPSNIQIFQGQNLMREAVSYIGPLQTPPRDVPGATHFMRFPMTNLLTLAGMTAVEHGKRYTILKSYRCKRSMLDHIAYLKEAA